MEEYILRKENCGYVLYDIESNNIFFAEIDVDNMYSESNYQLLSRAEKTFLPDNYFSIKCGRFIDNTKYNNAFSAPETVFLELTKKCNLRCKHCFNESGIQEQHELRFDEIKMLIDDLVRIGVFTIKITGGEPFCRQDILEILSYLESKPINYIVFSNGTNITENDIQKLKTFKHLLKIRISIDGNRDTNDSIRGNGSFDKAMKTIKQLCDNKIPCEINYTITSKNYKQIIDLASSLKENNILCNINIGMVKIAGRAKNKDEEYYFTKDNIANAIEYIKRQLHDIKCVKPYYLLEPIYYKLFGDSFGCPGARLTTTIKCTGEVYPCGLLSGYESFLCGNIRDIDFQEIWNNDKMNAFRHIPEQIKCKSCNYYLKSCTGACRGNALNYHNDICGEDINCLVYQIDFYE